MDLKDENETPLKNSPMKLRKMNELIRSRDMEYPSYTS